MCRFVHRAIDVGDTCLKVFLPQGGISFCVSVHESSHTVSSENPSSMSDRQDVHEDEFSDGCAKVCLPRTPAGQGICSWRFRDCLRLSVVHHHSLHIAMTSSNTVASDSEVGVSMKFEISYQLFHCAFALFCLRLALLFCLRLALLFCLRLAVLFSILFSHHWLFWLWLSRSSSESHCGSLLITNSFHTSNITAWYKNPWIHVFETHVQQCVLRQSVFLVVNSCFAMSSALRSDTTAASHV